MNSTFLMHCGGRPIGFDDPALSFVPQKTNTYEPVSFGELLLNTKRVCDDLLDMEFVDQKIAVSAKDKRMFGLLQYRKDEQDQIGHAVGIRSSHDKSMSIGFCSGATLFVCDNMAFTGEVTYMRKHTKNVFDDLKEKLVTTIYNSKDKLFNIELDAEKLKNIEINNDDAYAFIGKALGHKTLLARQAQKALEHWNKPPYAEFMNKDAWSLYNANTEALKSTQPNKIIEKHIDLHDRILDHFGIG
nr:hypothetical protein [uncultured Mediterranean phage uvMED]